MNEIIALIIGFFIFFLGFVSGSWGLTKSKKTLEEEDLSEDEKKVIKLIIARGNGHRFAGLGGMIVIAVILLGKFLLWINS